MLIKFLHSLKHLSFIIARHFHIAAERLASSLQDLVAKRNNDHERRRDIGTTMVVVGRWFRSNDLTYRGQRNKERMYSFDFSAPPPAVIIRESEETRTSTWWAE